MSSVPPSERGATAIVVAISLILLIGMAALAVDMGGAFDDRRQQQSAADVGSLAAVQYANTNHTLPPVCLAGSVLQRAACRGGVEAMAVVSGTLNGRFSAAEWTACVDTGDDATGYTVHSTVSDCISFTSNLKKARVVLPTTQVNTNFGR
ncbi:MAG: pilus assembly protein TadG-related protein, partial [Acidimicrobiia bacterium]